VKRRKRRNPYHGTQKDKLRSIREHGLSYPFLSSNEDQAACWGRGYAQGAHEARVLEFDVPDEYLVVPDFNIMEPYDREQVLGISPEEHYDVRESLGNSDDELLEAADEYYRLRGRNWVHDNECGGEASIYLGTVPWGDVRVVRRRNPVKCQLCRKRGGYSLPEVPSLCKKHYLMVWQRADPENAPLDVTKARSTGTTVELHPRGAYESDPDYPWSTVCVEHGGIVSHATKAAAKSFMAAPEEWCPGCQDASRWP
jgi:hypothetical protein